PHKAVNWYLSHEERAMSRVRVHNFSISLDGFGTGEGQGLESPFGHAGHRLNEWFFPTRSSGTRRMLPVHLFSDGRFRIVNAATFALGFGANGAFFLLALYLQHVRGNGALTAGLLLLPLTVAIIPGA